MLCGYSFRLLEYILCTPFIKTLQYLPSFITLHRLERSSSCKLLLTAECVCFTSQHLLPQLFRLVCRSKQIFHHSLGFVLPSIRAHACTSLRHQPCPTKWYPTDYPRRRCRLRNCTTYIHQLCVVWASIMQNVPSVPNSDDANHEIQPHCHSRA